MEETKKNKESMIDWINENKKLKEHNDRQWWKPSQGKHAIQFLDDGEPFILIMEGKNVEKIRFKIMVNGSVLDWSITRGITPNSLFGQVCKFADKHEGKLAGKTMTLVVKGQGKETTYTVLEVL